MYQKIFYVNVLSGRFCRGNNPHEYGAKPTFRHGETAEFDLVCLNDDGTPFYAGGAGFILAVDDNVNHGDELAVMSDDIIAEGNVIHVKAGCFSPKFATLVADGETAVRFFELSRVENGERRVFVYEDTGVKLFPRVRLDEGVPEENQPLDFVTSSDLANAGYVSADNVQQVVWSSIGDTIEAAVSAHDGENSAHAALFAGKAPLEHGHNISQVENLQTELDGKAATAHNHAELETALAGKAPSGHTHAELETALEGKAATDHVHAVDDVTGLEEELGSIEETLSTVNGDLSTLSGEFEQHKSETVHLVESYQNGMEWYRLYSDGWCEQGGSQTSTGNLTTVMLLKPYKDNNYNLVVSLKHSASVSAYERYIQTMNADSFIVRMYTAAGASNWHAAGYTAQGE